MFSLHTRIAAAISFLLITMFVSSACAQNLDQVKSRMLNRKPTLDSLKNQGVIGEDRKLDEAGLKSFNGRYDLEERSELDEDDLDEFDDADYLEELFYVSEHRRGSGGAEELEELFYMSEHRRGSG